MSHLGQEDADRFLITDRVPGGGQGKNEERAECYMGKPFGTVSAAVIDKSPSHSYGPVMCLDKFSV